ncbi:MAG: heme lyase CcmF/NrfE family subunit [Planctomycetota bacterium]|jgi:cytochrome c-type biogenesis protein CcmF
MITLGQLCLLAAFVASGYAAFACITGRRRDHGALCRSGDVAAVAGVLALTVVTVILASALVAKDLRFAYVGRYTSSTLPWHYSLSALWVGQSGSLLLWALLLGILAVAYRFWPRPDPSRLREYVFGVLMAYLGFLVAIMVFAADPMEPSLTAPGPGAGLSPLLQHPAMLFHPPIVFLGYAGWTVPFALAVVVLVGRRLDASWIREARRWATFSWAVSGGGILLGAVWAYEELGWGGYWGWDPVENGSLIPWLTGTALIHTLMCWQYRGVLKKTTLTLAIATFGLCNFATFLTRSGISSSLHAFSRSPIGWTFLAMGVVLGVGGGILLALRRSSLRADRPARSLLCRETAVLLATVAILLLAAAALVGTLAAPLSRTVLGRAITVGPPFYNFVLIPTGLVLLATMAVAPLLRWGTQPTKEQMRMLIASGVAGAAATGLAFLFGVRHPIALAVTCLAALAVAAVVGAWILDAAQQGPAKPWLRLVTVLGGARRRYAGYLIHLGFVALAVGVTGSSLGSGRCELFINEGQTVEWAGRCIRFVGLVQRTLPDKTVVEARLDVSSRGSDSHTLLPAQHFHLSQRQWTTEVSVRSSWSGDLYVILRGAEENGGVNLLLIENPTMRWIWLGAWVMGTGAALGLWPAGRLRGRRSANPPAAAATSSPWRMPPPRRERRAA